MIIFAKKRRSGKTTEAIKLASSTKSLLIVPTSNYASCVRRLAMELGYPVNVATANEYFGKTMRRYGMPRFQERIVIDELDVVLKEVFDCEVIMATATGFDTKLPRLKDAGKLKEIRDSHKKIMRHTNALWERVLKRGEDK